MMSKSLLNPDDTNTVIALAAKMPTGIINVDVGVVAKCNFLLRKAEEHKVPCFDAVCARSSVPLVTSVGPKELKGSAGRTRQNPMKETIIMWPSFEDRALDGGALDALVVHIVH
jgi:hypothetical protein